MNYFLCKFCNKPCRPCYEDAKSPARSMYDKHWRCDYHGVVVKHCGYPPDELTSVILSVQYKGYQYDCAFNYNDNVNAFPHPKFRIMKMNPSPRTVEIVMTLDFHPDLTPENISDKLPTLILFS